MTTTDKNETWTPKRTALLFKLWKEGLSARVIAERLGGGITRNAVISKIHRSPDSAEMQRRAARPKRSKEHVSTPRIPPRAPGMALIRQQPKVSVKPRPKPIARALPPPLPRPKLAVCDLTPQTCRWPIGDPQAPDFTFCGRTPRGNHKYCEYHAQLGVQPAPDKRMQRMVSK